MAYAYWRFVFGAFAAVDAVSFARHERREREKIEESRGNFFGGWFSGHPVRLDTSWEGFGRGPQSSSGASESSRFARKQSPRRTAAAVEK